MIIKKRHEKGLKSEHAYCAGFLSIGLSVASWFGSMKVEPLGVARADRCGIFVAEWASSASLSAWPSRTTSTTTSTRRSRRFEPE
ncbi:MULTISPECIES: hypothetical protein [unclassified Streptomyces]|uniref:hypothetical protein n=1 Tax=unclassified Streptomyces TaxID=2593676 RepID=UPI002E13FF45